MMRWLFALITLQATASTLQSAWKNREGLLKYHAQSYYPAYQAFLKALESDPLNPLIHMNLARTFEANEEFEKAETGYRSALQLLAKDEPLRFQALFNLGGVLAKQHKIPDALQAYQAALEINPESKEVKTNIELIWSQGNGGGESQDKDKKGNQNQQKKQGEGENKDKDKQQDQKSQPDKDQKRQPKPFDSQELTPQDVQKILDEIKNQEQSIRAQEYERNAKEAPRGKDW